MAMTFFLHDNFDSEENLETNSVFRSGIRSSKSEEFHILSEKLRIPEFERLVSRPRLTGLLDKSQSLFGATLVSGRAGTGKTALAADFAHGQQKALWYTIESPDIDWSVFANYFDACLFGTGNRVRPQEKDEVGQEAIAEYLASVFTRIGAVYGEKSVLIVLDDIHHVFDAPWFNDFFSLLITSLLPNTHLLLLCRSKPPAPLWRLRSKQMLYVIDEKILAFTEAETQELCANYQLPSAFARKAHTEAFGRVSKLTRLLEIAAENGPAD